MQAYLMRLLSFIWGAEFVLKALQFEKIKLSIHEIYN